MAKSSVSLPRPPVGLVDLGPAFRPRTEIRPFDPKATFPPIRIDKRQFLVWPDSEWSVSSSFPVKPGSGASVGVDNAGQSLSFTASPWPPVGETRSYRFTGLKPGPRVTTDENSPEWGRVKPSTAGFWLEISRAGGAWERVEAEHDFYVIDFFLNVDALSLEEQPTATDGKGPLEVRPGGSFYVLAWYPRDGVEDGGFKPILSSNTYDDYSFGLGAKISLTARFLGMPAPSQLLEKSSEVKRFEFRVPDKQAPTLTAVEIVAECEIDAQLISRTTRGVDAPRITKRTKTYSVPIRIR